MRLSNEDLREENAYEERNRKAPFHDALIGEVRSVYTLIYSSKHLNEFAMGLWPTHRARPSELSHTCRPSRVG